MKNNMLIIGPNNCGKSKFAEKIIESVEKQLFYFATLPNNSQFVNKIFLHKARRNNLWKVHETDLDVFEDLNQIKMRLKSGHLMLFDGLAIYIQRILSLDKSNDILCSLLDSLIRILSSQKKSWIIVDIGWQYIDVENQYILSEWTKCFQVNILSKCNVKLITNNGDDFYGD